MYKRPSYLLSAVAALLAGVKSPGVVKLDPASQIIPARFYRDTQRAHRASRTRSYGRANSPHVRHADPAAFGLTARDKQNIAAAIAKRQRKALKLTQPRRF